MTKDKFIEICEHLRTHDELLNSVGVFKDGLIEINDCLFKVIHVLLESIYTSEGVDWFYWFMYEKGYIFGSSHDKEELKAYDENGAEILKTLEELYDFMNEHFLVKNS